MQTMFLFWTVTILLAHSSLQMSDPNCLRANPEVLDGDFLLFNKFEDWMAVTEEDVAKQVGLFATRFKRAHELYAITPTQLNLIGKGVSRYTASSGNNVQFFLKVGKGVNKLDEAILLYKENYETVLKINSGNAGPVVGLYMPDLLSSYAEELEAVELAFGSKENSTFPTGHYFRNCSNVFGRLDTVGYLQRLHFMTCRIDPANKPSPEASADDAIRVCDEFREVANSINVTAEIMCSVGYPSQGISSTGVIGSVLSFQRFWCRIVGEMARNKSHVQIIMRSAFDDSPSNYKSNAEYLEGGRFHGGWWRRRHTTSYEADAFVEKVEELEGGREHGKCGAECTHCNSSEACCDGRICESDLSFQPFEQGNSTGVCQSANTTCAPRPPATAFAYNKSKGSVVFPVKMAVIFMASCYGLLFYLIFQ